MKTPTRYLLPLLAVLALSSVACGQVLSAGAALVNGTSISQETVDAQVDQQLRGQQAPQAGGEEARVQLARQVLLTLIQQEVVRQEALSRGLRASDEAVDQQYSQIGSQFQNEAEFLQRMQEAGLTPDTLRSRIRDSLLVDQLREQLSGAVPDAQVAAQYEEQINQYREIRVKHILFSIDQQTSDAQAKKAAQDALAKLRGGADFATLAKTSDDPGSKDKGGELEGFIPLANLDEAFARAAWAAKVGVVTAPVRSQFGYHLIVTLAKKTAPLAEVADQIRSQLQQQSGDAALNRFLRDVLGRATIIVNPRYGDWDAETGTIVPHKLFEEPDRPADQDQPAFVQPEPGF